MSLPLIVLEERSDSRKCKYLPCITASPSWTSSVDELLEIAEEELGSRSVYWTRPGDRSCMVFSSPRISSKQPIHQRDECKKETSSERRHYALLARFKPGAPPSPVVIGSEFATVIFSTGETFECPLPQCSTGPAQYLGVYGLPLGTIFKVGSGAGSKTATYYLMTHPLKDPKKLDQLEECENVVFTSMDLFLIVTKDDRKKVVNIWSLKDRNRDPTSGEKPCLTKLREIKIPEDRAEQNVFLAHSAKDQLALCIVVAPQMHVLALTLAENQGTHTQIDPLDKSVVYKWLLPKDAEKCFPPVLLEVISIGEAYVAENVLAAEGISGRRFGVVDIMCLTENEELELRMGPRLVAKFHVPDGFPCTGLRDGIGSRLSLLDSSGNLLRVSVENVTVEDSLTATCLACLEDHLTLEEFTTIHLRMLEARAETLEAGDASSWSVLCMSLIEFCPKELTADSGTLKESSDWEWLQAGVSSPASEARAIVALVQSRAYSEQRVDLKKIVDSLHLIYENARLTVLTSCNLVRLAALNALLSAAVGYISLCEYYKAQHGDDILHEEFSGLMSRKQPEAQTKTHVPDIYVWLSRCLERRSEVERFSGLLPSDGQVTHSKWDALNEEGPAGLLSKVMLVFKELAVGKRMTNLERALHIIVQSGLQPADVDNLHFGVRLVFMDVLRECKAAPRQTWVPAACVLIGRDDLAMKESRADGKHDWTSIVRLNYEALKYSQSSDSVYGENNGRPKPIHSMETDGCETEDPALRLRFGADRRMEEVRRLLRCSEPVPMRAPDRGDIDLSDPRQHELFFQKLLRSLASGVGRGALVLHTYSPSDPTEKLRIPKLALSGRLKNRNGAIINLDRGTLNNGELDWPEFHNGAAVGLRVVRGDGNILTRTWIVYNRPTEESGTSTYAGLLLALGISGHLPSLRVTDWYQHLLPRHELTSLALMIGIGACNQKSMHPVASKLLGLHVRHFNAAGFAQSDWNVTLPVQAAALIGLGLLYLGSCHRVIVEGMVAELTRRPSPSEDPKGREGLSLAAGLAVGMVCLGSGGASKTLSDLHVEDRLSLFITGGKHESRIQDSQHDVQSDVETEPQLVKESDSVDVDTTAPGAIMALTLIYLKSNDSSALRWVPLPESRFDIQMIRPHHVLLHVLSRSLIMWDSIEANQSWLCKSIPAVLRNTTDTEGQIFEGLFSPPARKTDGEKEIPKTKSADDNPDSDKKSAEDGSEAQEDGAANSESDEEDIDSLSPGLVEARAMALCGACLAIGLRFAGTTDPNAFSLLLQATKSFSKGAGATYQLCVDSLCLATSLVMAGTGNLDCMRELRRLQARSSAKNYGSQLACSMALGILFLGGGSLSFDTSSETIAALLCAIYPRFPSKTDDNRYHLQALRHLYALAAKPRLLEAREVDTGALAYVPIKVKVQGSAAPLDLVTPCQLSQVELIESISVDSPRYWPLELKLFGSMLERKVIYVKRKAAHLPYEDDPKGVKGILSRTDGRLSEGVSGFSVDPVALSFTKHLCTTGPRAKFYESILRDSLTKDKPHLLGFYLELEQLTREQTEISRSLQAANVLLTRSYLSYLGGSSLLLNAPFFASVVLQSKLDERSPAKVGGMKGRDVEAVLSRTDAYSVAKYLRHTRQ